MKKRIIMLLLLMALCLSCTACKPVPEEVQRYNTIRMMNNWKW